MNLAEYLSLHARYRAGQIAVDDDRAPVTYAELDERARRAATALIRRGVRPGDLVGVCLKDGASQLALWMAIVRIGAVVIPMDWRWTPEEQTQIGRVFRPRTIFVEQSRKVGDDLAVVRHDDAWEREVATAPAHDRIVPGEDLPVIMNMSSGTTGLPKGNVHTHRTYLGILMAQWVDIGQRPDDRILSVLPMASAAGRAGVLSAVLGGGSVRFMPPLVEPSEIVSAVERYRIDTLCCVPAILRQLLPLAVGDKVLLPDLRLLISVGAMLFPEESNDVRRRLSPNLVNYYGSTGGGVNTVLYPDELARKPGSVGRPVLGTDLEIVDDNDRRLLRDTTGRLRVRCPSTCKGVYPPDAADTSYREGWHYPGDYALVDEDGYLFLQGRYNDIIIRGGSNVYAPEVERVLLGLEGVREAAVIGVPNEILGEDVVAFVAGDRPIERNEIMQHCRGKLAAYKVPTRIHFIDVLPRNSAGKILKRKLLETPDDRVTPEVGGLKAD